MLEDILVEIFHHMDPATLLCCRCVDRKWLRAADHIVLSRFVRFLQRPELLTPCLVVVNFATLGRKRPVRDQPLFESYEDFVKRKRNRNRPLEDELFVAP